MRIMSEETAYKYGKTRKERRGNAVCLHCNFLNVKEKPLEGWWSLSKANCTHPKKRDKPILGQSITVRRVCPYFSDNALYKGRLCTIRRMGKLLRVEPASGALLYERDELLIETQMILAALLGAPR